jgi:hypothetical protein
MSLSGKLLVATPLIGDPHFERSVVLLLAHGLDGAFGVIVNRPTETDVDEVAPAWREHVAAPAVVFLGGPVGEEVVTGIGRPVVAPTPGYAPLAAGVGSVVRRFGRVGARPARGRGARARLVGAARRPRRRAHERPVVVVVPGAAASAGPGGLVRQLPPRRLGQLTGRRRSAAAGWSGQARQQDGQPRNGTGGR